METEGVFSLGFHFLQLYRFYKMVLSRLVLLDETIVHI